MFEVFARNWYKIENNELVPDYEAEITHIGYADTTSEARQMCQEYNDNNDETILSHKAEFRS